MNITLTINSLEEIDKAIELLQSLKVNTSKPNKVAKPIKEQVQPITETETVEITLEELTALAKEKVAATDRQTVKDIISKYASKLSSVNEPDYAALKEDLNAI